MTTAAEIDLLQAAADIRFRELVGPFEAMLQLSEQEAWTQLERYAHRFDFRIRRAKVRQRFIKRWRR